MIEIVAKLVMHKHMQRCKRVLENDSLFTEYVLSVLGYYLKRETTL